MKWHHGMLYLFALCVVSVASAVASVGAEDAIAKSEFIFTDAPFPSCHASTIAETKSGLVAAWFGGTAERNPDVCIYVSRNENGTWTPPGAVANGVGFATNRFPTWNPVLFQPKSGPLMLFYKVGPSPATWWGMMMTSDDDGKTWSAPRHLPDGIIGPTKNKPVQLVNGDILCGSSTEGERGWRVHFERTSDLGKTWSATPPVNDPKEISAIQPSILFHRDDRLGHADSGNTAASIRGPLPVLNGTLSPSEGERDGVRGIPLLAQVAQVQNGTLGESTLQAIGRTKQGRIFEIWSDDGGKTWGKMTLIDLPNPDSGIDAVTLKDGRQLVVYNHNVRTGSNNKGRSPLNVAVSPDGKRWFAALVLEDNPNAPNGFAYPAVIQARDGLVHITYTWERKRIKHVVLDPAKLQLKPIVNGEWPN